MSDRLEAFSDRDLQEMQLWANEWNASPLRAEIDREVRARTIEAEALAAGDAVRARYSMLDEIEQTVSPDAEFLARRAQWRHDHNLPTRDEFVRTPADTIAGQR